MNVLIGMRTGESAILETSAGRISIEVHRMQRTAYSQQADSGKRTHGL